MFSNKTLIIIISVLILIAGGILIYYYYSQETEPVDGTETQPTTSDPTSTSRIKRISQESVLGVTIDDQKAKYYSKENGNVFESNLNGSGTVLVSSSALPDLLKVLWSPSKNKVIAIFDQNGEAKKYSYDYTTGISTPLDDNIGWISWSPKEDKIAYQYNSPIAGNNISIADSDGSDWTSVFQTRMKDLIVEWPGSSRLSIRTKPSGLAESILYTISLADGDFKKMIGETYGLAVLWSPLGDKVLFSETDSQGKNLKLKVLETKTQTIQELNLATLPEKCAWSQDNRTIFCAVPKDISTRAVLPDDYYKKIISFADDFYRINLETKGETRIYKTENEEATAYDAKELLLSPQEDYLIFINQKDGQLYSLKL